MKIRALQRELTSMLKGEDLSDALARIKEYPADKALKALFSCLCSCDQQVKWHAVTAMGQLVSSRADQDIEAARIVMRRFMWMLNDESGGIGWGVPETFGEVTASHKVLAREYAHILVSFMREDGFYLELESLQQGLMWGVARLGQVEPELLAAKGAVRYLLAYLKSPDLAVRGLAALALGHIASPDIISELKPLQNINNKVQVYTDRHFVVYTVGELASAAIVELAG